jgi:ankyrin repeat protein
MNRAFNLCALVVVSLLLISCSPQAKVARHSSDVADSVRPRPARTSSHDVGDDEDAFGDPFADTTSEGGAGDSPVETDDTPEVIVITPHEYLERGEPEKAIETMAADPKWITVLDESERMPLHVASWYGPPSAVEWLLEHGADVDTPDTFGLTPLHYAQDPAIVRLLLARKADLTVRGNRDRTPPQHAAWRFAEASDKDRERWQQIVAIYEEAMGGKDLTMAVILGDIARVKEILSKSPELADDPEGESLLRIAVSRGNFEICRYLLEEHRVDVDDWERGHGYSILKVALSRPDIVRLLIRHGADLKTRLTLRLDRSGYWPIGDGATALHYAARDGHTETIRLLIDSGVDIGAAAHRHWEANDDQSALEIASANGNFGNVEAIVSHPLFDAVSPDRRQAHLDSAFLFSLFRAGSEPGRDHQKITQLLLQKGANPNAVSSGFTPLQFVVCEMVPQGNADNKREKQLIDFLTDHGAEIDLFSAAALGNQEETQRLLKSNRRLTNLRGPDGCACLHYATAMNHRETVIALLAAGADVNVRVENERAGGSGNTPLDLAEIWNRDEIATLLIKAGGKRQAELTPQAK